MFVFVFRNTEAGQRLRKAYRAVIVADRCVPVQREKR